jgi:hypothetical protein
MSVDRDSGIQPFVGDGVVLVATRPKRFTSIPPILLPNAGGSFSSSGITRIPDAGTVFPKVHVTAASGVLEADMRHCLTGSVAGEACLRLNTRFSVKRLAWYGGAYVEYQRGLLCASDRAG